MSKTLMGSTAFSRILSCDSVMDGVFFPQSDANVPEEEMSQDAGQHVVMPPRILPDFIVIHAQFGFGFFKALLNGPTNAA